MLLGLIAEARPKEYPLSNAALRSVRFNAPIRLALDALNVWTTSEREDYDAHPRRCVFASVRPGWSARTCCNVAIAGTEWSSRASRHAWSPTLVHSPSRRRSRVHRCARFGLVN